MNSIHAFSPGNDQCSCKHDVTTTHSHFSPFLPCITFLPAILRRPSKRLYFPKNLKKHLTTISKSLYSFPHHPTTTGPGHSFIDLGHPFHSRFNLPLLGW